MTKTTPLPTAMQEAVNNRLGVAVFNNDVAAIRQAIEDGADINAPAQYSSFPKNTPLRVAAFKGHALAAQALVEAGANVDGEEYPLFTAAFFGHISVVKILLEAGATVDLEYHAPGDHNRTPLHGASNEGILEIAKLLLAAGADPSHKGGFADKTVIELAHRNHHTAFAEYVQSVQDNPAKRPTPEEAGLDIEKRIAALDALGKPLGQFTQLERMRKAQRETREAQRQAALNGEGI